MKMGGDISRLARHVSIYAVGNILSRGGAFVLIPLYTRFLIPSEYGVLELLYSLAAMAVSFLSLGLPHATLRFYFEYDAIDDRKAVVSTSVLAAAGMALAGVLVLSTGNTLVQKLLFRERPVGDLIGIVYAGLALDIVSQIGFAYLRAREYSAVFVMASLARLITQVSANLYSVVVLRMGVEGILYGNLLATTMECAIVGFITIRECGLRFDACKFRSLVGYSYPFIVSGVIGVVAGNVDRVFIGSLRSLDRVGVYALALKFGMGISVLLIEPFQRAYGAFRFSVIKQANAAQLQARVLVYVLSAVTLVGLGVALFAREAVALLGAPSYRDAATVLPVMMLAVSLGSSVYILQTGILYRKVTKYIVWISLATSSLGLIVTFVGVRTWGILGAALAQLAVTTLNVWLTHRFSQRLWPVPYPYRKVANIYGLAIALFVLGQCSLVLDTLLSVVVRGMLAISYAVGIVVLGIVTREECRMAAAYVRDSGNRVLALLGVAGGRG